jgi:hypothetical protein
MVRSGKETGEQLKERPSLVVTVWRNAADNAIERTMFCVRRKREVTRMDIRELCDDVLRRSMDARPKLFIDLQYRHKSLLRHLDIPDGFHTLLSRFLLFEKLFLSGNVSAVAFRKNILALRFDVCS